MKLLSLNIGRPQDKEWMGTTVRTSIFKKPVIGRLKVSLTHIEGDEQADLRVHGGVEKAVYSYDVSYYSHWKNILDREDWTYGLFGENLTTEGFRDDEVRIGNIYQIGTAKLQAIQPRFPCLKINVRFGLPDMIELFVNERKNGIYFKVVEEGELQVNDPIQLLEESPHEVTIQDFVECYYSKGSDKSVLKKIVVVPHLPESKRRVFESFL
jgi:MOSC domain-containing protein YiiM